MSPKHRVLIVHNIMAPYRFPLFRALANHPNIDLTVWFMSRSAKNRKWAQYDDVLGFNYEILPSIELSYFRHDLFTYVLNYTFPWQYARQRFDVLISAGWFEFTCQLGFFASKLMGRKFVLWSESTAFEPSIRRSLAAPLVKTMARGADTCVAAGIRSKEYFKSLGARDENIFTSFNAIDVEHFQRTSNVARRTRAQDRKGLGIKRGRVLLYCGQFIERKGLHYLLEAFALIKQQYEDVALLLVGYGPTQADLLADVARLGLNDVHFLEHVEVADMPKMYALADVFVLPSLEEVWGLVVNEAMACGLPVIVTDRVGSSADLVRDGENGFVVAAGDAASIADRCLRLLRDEMLLASFARCSAEQIQSFTPQRAADALAAAVAHALHSPFGTPYSRSGDGGSSG